MTTGETFDVFIIGGGQAAIPLAWALAGAGQRVALAERKQLGGSCVNFGCTPTKAAIASAKLAHQARRAGEYGLHIPSVDVDFPAVLARAGRIAQESRSGIEKALEGTDSPRLIPHHARLDGRDAAAFRVRAGDDVYAARQVVLNMGTRSLIPPIPGLDQTPYIHAGNWLDHSRLPERLAIMGGGYIGLEMGQFYRRMGSQVTVIDRNARVIPHEDEDISAELQARLEAEGIVFRLDTEVKRVESEHGIVLTVDTGGAEDTLQATDLFVAVGRQPNTDDAGLETLGVKMAEHGYVSVDERLATSVEGVWASGDIRGGPLFTHTSWDDNRILQSQMIGDHSRTTRRIVPYAVFTDPELGRVGMTEAEARRTGRKIEVAKFAMSHSGKAAEIGETEGYIKVIADAETKRLLGAAALCADGAELVHIYIDIMNADAPYTVIVNAIHIHPTLAEAAQSAVAALK